MSTSLATGEHSFGLPARSGPQKLEMPPSSSGLIIGYTTWGSIARVLKVRIFFCLERLHGTPKLGFGIENFA
jgi:hypothetical protein